LRPRAERPNGKNRGGTPTGERVPQGALARHHERLRLPAFRLPYFRTVIAGLDPAIHADEKLNRISRLAFQNDKSAWTTGSSPVVTK
jgi:hypothetical protein